MKRLFTVCLWLALSGLAWGQVPNAFNYQGVARNASGVALPNQSISLQTGFFHGSVNGAVRYQERHFLTTNDLGLYTLRLGEGIPVVGDWDSIAWDREKVFLRVDGDMTGGNNYTSVGFSEFASVPYALVAGTAADVTDGDTSAYNELQMLSRVGDTIFISGGNYIVLPSGTIDTDDQSLALVGDSLVIQDGNGVDLSGFRDNTDAQTLGLSGQALTISNGNTVVLPDKVNDADADPQNEFQTISKTGSTVILSDNGGAFVDDVNDADADPVNELQQLTKVGALVSLSNGGGSFTDETDDADADPGNELQQMTKVGAVVSLSNGGGGFTDETDDADADPANELQQLSLSGDTVAISNGNYVVLPPGAVDTDEQNLSLAGDSLLIQDGLGVDMGAFRDNTDSQTLAISGHNLSIANGNTVVLPDQVDDADADSTNELQQLAQQGPIVTLSQNGGAFSVQDADADPFNELQGLSKSGQTVSLSNNGGSFTDDVDDADADPANELQSLIIANNTISISQGNSIVLPPPTVNTDTQGLSLIDDTLFIDNGNAVDLGPYLDNTDGQTLSLSGQDLTISGGNTLTLPDAVDDADADPGNELQMLSRSNDTLFISNGNFVVLPAGTVDTDDQTLSLSGNSLAIDNGNSVDLTSFMDNTDGQTLSLSGSQLSLTNGGSVNLNGLGGGAGFWDQPGADLYPNSASRVGIGITSPSVKLHVSEVDDAPMAAIHGEGYNGNGPTFGQVGVQGHDDHHGIPALDINDVEIGILGVAIYTGNSSGFNSDNYGVWGHADGFGGRFQYDNNGVAQNMVFLGSDSFAVHSDGMVGIYTSKPKVDLHIKQSTSHNTIPETGGIILEELDGDKWTIWAGGDDVNFGLNGSIKSYVDENGGYQTFSDRRLKKNLSRMGNVLPRVMELKPTYYHYKSQAENAPKVIGFIAQEVRPLFPNAVSIKSEEAMLALNYDSFGVIAIQAIQEQQALIEGQARQIKALESRLSALESPQN